MRDAIPQWEIDGLVKRIAKGEPLEVIRASAPTILPIWFERNEAALYRLAGVAQPAAPAPEVSAPAVPQVVEHKRRGRPPKQ